MSEFDTIQIKRLANVDECNAFLEELALESFVDIKFDEASYYIIYKTKA